MANLDKLLKQIEKRKAQELEQDERLEKININGEEYDVRLLNKQNKKELTCLMTDYGVQKQSSLILVEKGKSFIYKALPEMSKLAVKAKEAKLIEKYYDIVEENFTTKEILEILSFICDINDISDENLEKENEQEIDELKKQ